jgi:hypothetical protein
MNVRALLIILTKSKTIACAKSKALAAFNEVMLFNLDDIVLLVLENVLTIFTENAVCGQYLKLSSLFTYVNNEARISSYLSFRKL